MQLQVNGERVHYDSATSLSESITVNVEVGGYAPGDIVPAGTTFDELVLSLLRKYFPPQITLTSSDTDTVLLVGASTPSSVTLTASATKKSNDITSIKFYTDGVVVNTVTEEVATGGDKTYNINSAVTKTTSSNLVYKAGITDTTENAEQYSNEIVYKWEVPVYTTNSANTALYSAITADGLTDTTEVDLSTPGCQVKLIGKTNINYNSITGTDIKMIVGYPASYGDLASIEDGNGLEMLESFTKFTRNVVVNTGVDAISYYFYIANTASSLTNFEITAKF